MLDDRKDAGRKLGQVLLKYKGPDTYVLAIHREGSEACYQVAKALDTFQSLIIARKLSLPDNPGVGGTVAEIYRNLYDLPDEEVLEIMKKDPEP
jgi:putative phosphoribosyl transferase